MKNEHRPVPKPTPETRHFWEGTREGKLLLQHCAHCESTYFPPRPFCPRCSSSDITLRMATGRATLHSYVINHLAPRDWSVPYAIAVVQLEEGPKMMANITGCPQTPEALILDMPLQVKFEKLNDDITLPLFEPLEKQS
ncbi:MAG: Zn-ribbon domain-containing OB-fold protein [Pigmentiphaga sp.]